MSTTRLSFDQTDSPAIRIVFGNEGGGTPRYSPDEFTVSINPQSLASDGTVDAVRLEIPPSWVSDRPLWRLVRADHDVIEWRVSVSGEPRRYQEYVRLVALSDGSEVLTRERAVEIHLRLVSQFDPQEHVISRPNNVAGWGVVKPSRAGLDRTFTRLPFADQFLRGLYRSIVFLNGDGSNPGGLCTGMARAALERSLTHQARDPALDEVIFWHGRQLSDRALLRGAISLFFGSPRRAFCALRDDLLQDGRSDRCFDIGIPRPWRRDIVTALQTQGHTVVPYAIEQTSPDQARVLVYDPNDPDASKCGNAAITFLLDEDTYIYEPFGSSPLVRTTVIAVCQDAYRKGRTAVLAATASALMALTYRLRSAWALSVAPVRDSTASLS